MRGKSFLITVVVLSQLAFTNCRKEDPETDAGYNYKQEMRNFVIDLSAYAKKINPYFVIIPQNGQELITNNDETDGSLQTKYIDAIDATGREDMFYGYDNDDEATPDEEKQYLVDLCSLFEQQNIEVLATDYCSTHSKMDNSYKLNEQNKFISFSANERDLNNIPDYPDKPYNENSDDITQISQAKNFLYLINSEDFTSKQDFISTVSNTNYDVIIMDLYHNETIYTQSDIDILKTKDNGGKRLVICYMSIGECEDYRYYWQDNWKVGSPEWIVATNTDWEGNYKVKYWDKEWQNIIFGYDNSYLYKILSVGFDGVYLDIIDGFEYFEED